MGSKKNERAGWRPVRMRLGTLARLDAYRTELVQQAEQGREVPTERGSPGGGPVSYDALVSLLLDALDAHRRRARKQRAMSKLDARLAAEVEALDAPSAD